MCKNKCGRQRQVSPQTYLVDVRCDVLVLDDDEELIQAAAVLQEGLRVTLPVAQTHQVLLHRGTKRETSSAIKAQY